MRNLGSTMNSTRLELEAKCGSVFGDESHLITLSSKCPLDLSVLLAALDARLEDMVRHAVDRL